MRLLNFDTSLDKTYVTLSDDEKILSTEVIENHNEKYHSAYLIPVIVDILKKNNFYMQDIDAISTNIGPGSFTGIRACVTVARVLAQQLNLPLVGVSSLEILSKINKINKKTLVVLDARKQQFYTAMYDKDKELVPPALTNADDVLRFDFSDCIVISDMSTNKFLKENGVESLVYTDSSENLGLYLNKIARQKLVNFSKDDYFWAKLKPLYLQTPPVSMPAKPKI